MFFLGSTILAAVVLQQNPSLAAKSTRTAVPVLTRVESNMFPSSWTNASVRATAQPLDPSEVDRSVNILKHAMDKYPSRVIQQNLRKVYVCQKLMFYGLSYGGTNSADSLYLANRGKNFGFSDQFLEESFHHEFSSILLRNYYDIFDADAWSSCNGTMKYRVDGTQAVREGTASTHYDSKFNQQGFLAQYATASLEEDFNMMAEGLFSGSRKYWQTIDAYPRLKHKMQAIVNFYHRLDPVFTEARFRSFQRT